MAFPQRLLTEGEEVVAELRSHWSALGWSAPTFVVSLVALIAVLVAWAGVPGFVVDLLLVLTVVCALWLAGRWLRWWTTTLVVTTGRLVQRTGVLARRGTDIRLERINEISYQQSIWQRMLGTGRLFVDVGGDRGVVAFDHVRHPASVASLVHEEIAALSGSPAGADRGPHVAMGYHPAPVVLPATAAAHDTPPTGTPISRAPGDQSVAQRLIELDELRRRGLLTQAEFAERRARLLDQL